MEAAYTVGPCHYRRIKFTGTLRLWAKYSLHFMDIWIWKKTYYTIQLGLIVTQSSVYYSWLYWNCIIRGPFSSFEWKQNSNTATQYEAWSFFEHIIVYYIFVNYFVNYFIVMFWRLSPSVSTSPITAMGCRQCWPLSVFQLKGKHCRKANYRNGVLDTFGHCVLKQNKIKVC